MLLRVEIVRVQQIERLTLELDLAENKLSCIVGKNGVGKTTLVRALRNLSLADTFIKTAGTDVFTADSSIEYQWNGRSIRFAYDEDLQSLNCKAHIPPDIKGLCKAELPMPYGERFNFFQTVSDADTGIRRQIILEEYTRPTELINFLFDIYGDEKFQSLVEVQVDDRRYYCVLKDSNRYVREDYLSSGEFFLISLYRAIRGGARLLVVDEIDLSLDPAAQVHLLTKLRLLCQQYSCNVLFTTHSMAMMRTLSPAELMYMERRDTRTELSNVSYGYIKTLLFGFVGWDRYILTEDQVAHEFVETIIRRYCREVFYQYKIIHVGGGFQVADLLRRNERERFLSSPENVIAILDGDQKAVSYAQHPNIRFLPFESVEKALLQLYGEEDFPRRLPAGVKFDGHAKHLFKMLQSAQIMTRADIYSLLCDKGGESICEFARGLEEFLSLTAST